MHHSTFFWLHHRDIATKRNVSRNIAVLHTAPTNIINQEMAVPELSQWNWNKWNEDTSPRKVTCPLKRKSHVPTRTNRAMIIDHVGGWPVYMTACRWTFALTNPDLMEWLYLSTLLNWDVSPLKLGDELWDRQCITKSMYYCISLVVNSLCLTCLYWIGETFTVHKRQVEVYQHLQKGAKWFLKGINSPSLRV